MKPAHEITGPWQWVRSGLLQARCQKWRKRLKKDCLAGIAYINSRLEGKKAFEYHHGKRYANHEGKVLRGMRTDLKYTIGQLEDKPDGETDWSRQPWYSREIPMDSHILTETIEGHGRVGCSDGEGEAGYYAVDSFLNILTEQQRDVFRLTYAAQMTRREVGEAMRMSEGNVYNVLNAIEKKRKKFLGEWQEGMIL